MTLENLLLFETEKSFDVIFERKMKIKIFTKAGLKMGRNVNSLITTRSLNMKTFRHSKPILYNLENGKIRVSALASKKHLQ